MSNRPQFQVEVQYQNGMRLTQGADTHGMAEYLRMAHTITEGVAKVKVTSKDGRWVYV